VLDGLHGLHKVDDSFEKATLARVLRLETMIAARKVVDEAEAVCPEKCWTLATYKVRSVCAACAQRARSARYSRAPLPPPPFPLLGASLPRLAPELGLLKRECTLAASWAVLSRAVTRSVTAC
jgi:hypothetical protein